MGNKEKTDKTDTYMFILMGLFYLYIYGKNIIDHAKNTTGWDWLFFIILSIITLFFYLVALMFSCLLALQVREYFGLPKNYLVATILAVVSAPLTMLLLSLTLSGVIPSLFGPRFN